MIYIRLLATWASAALSSLIILGAVDAPSAEQQIDPWANLKEKTAWIVLGIKDEKSGEWVSEAGYYIVRGGSPGDARSPSVGAVLAITHNLDLEILGFKVSGESRRLEPPTDVPSEPINYTGGVLKPGMRVVVRDVRRSRTSADTNYLYEVWARVTPD